MNKISNKTLKCFCPSKLIQLEFDRWESQKSQVCVYQWIKNILKNSSILNMTSLTPLVYD
jgi:hypothetical protein